MDTAKSSTARLGVAPLTVMLPRLLRNTVMQHAVTHEMTASSVVEKALSAYFRTRHDADLLKAACEALVPKLRKEDLPVLYPALHRMDTWEEYLHAIALLRRATQQAPHQEEHAEYVYIIQASKTDFVKIGRSTSVAKRLRSIQSGCMYRLEVVLALQTQNAAELEWRLHTALWRFCVQGEWFCLPAPLLGMLLNPDDDTPIVDLQRQLEQTFNNGVS